MATTPIWFTPAEWKIREGATNPNNISPTEAILLEIYNQLYNSSGSDMISLYGTTDGTADLQDDLLIGKSVKAVWLDGVLLIPTTDYTVDAGTGTITFINVPDTGINVLIFYTA